MQTENPHPPLPFMKMHGLGNDFVVIDARGQKDCVTPELARAVGDRHTGVGFDQLAVILGGPGDAHLVFCNSDGSTELHYTLIHLLLLWLYERMRLLQKLPQP